MTPSAEPQTRPEPDAAAPAGDAIIVGGSLNGATLALALAQGGMRVTVLDAMPDGAQEAEGFDGRCYALAHASVRMLTALGLWEALAAEAQPILQIKVSEGRAGEGPRPFVLRFDHAELEEGPMGHMVEDRHLRRALIAALRENPGVDYRPGSQVAAQSTGGGAAEVVLADGTRLTAPLIVGADGRASGTAARAGIGRRGRAYRQTALVCAVGHERDHGGTAHQFFMPAGPLAILPLTGRRSTIVWSESARQAAGVQALGDAEYLQVLRPRFGDFLGDIEIAGARYTYPLSLSVAEALTAPRLALVGDAARGVHPIAGQGLNAGLRDVASLAEVALAAMRRGEDHGRAEVLERYARWRRFDGAMLTATTDGFNRLFSNDSAALALVRNLGMGAVQALPGLRRAIMRDAAGLSGALPRLMLGEPA